jgi:integrase
MQRGSLKPVKYQGAKAWRAQWREAGKGRTRILWRCADLSRGEARAELDRIVAAVSGREFQAAPIVDTLRQYTENEYLAQMTRRWKASTAATTEQIIETHILCEIGARPLAAITRKELQALLDRKTTDGLSFSVVAHIRWQLRAILRMAKSDGLITTEPAEALVTPTQATTDKRVIGPEDIVRAQMVHNLPERLILRLAVCEGMRPGEIVGLKIMDIQADGIHVERRIYRGKVDTPKSTRSRRLIPPTPATRELLVRYIELIGDGDPDCWLFASERGATPVSYSNIYRRRIQPALARVRLGYVNFQILRRSWVTEFSQVEEDPHVRARLGGHSVDVHENHYRQGKAEVLQASMDKLGKHLQ